MPKGNRAKKKKGNTPIVNYAQERKKKVREEEHKVAQAQAAKVTIQFYPIDTWFFRESRPHDAAGASELSSLFPPPIYTIAGALRSFLGEQKGGNWKAILSDTSEFNFSKIWGDANSLGETELNGVWVCYKAQRCYPAPLYLMHKEDVYARLSPGEPVHCDLGKNVCLPKLGEEYAGSKNLENVWLTKNGMAKCLRGGLPDGKDIIQAKQLFSHESRLGIARNNASRAVITGKLYQTRHLRLSSQVHIELDVKKIPSVWREYLPNNMQKSILRLGGEGRMASITTASMAAALPEHTTKGDPKIAQFIIHFITPAYFSGEVFPQGFKKTENTEKNKTVWRGTINEIEFEIESAVIGKVWREGGWDMQNRQPKAVKSYLPAGSAWFCRLIEKKKWSEIKAALHECCIGEETAYGRGQILLGDWPDTTNI